MKNKILIACEESQRVTKHFRDLGAEAFSCDIEPCSGENPEWHIQEDLKNIINEEWAAIIAFPPCTYLSVVGNVHFSPKKNSLEKIEDRQKLRKEAFDFVMMIANAKCPKISIENPVGYLNNNFRKPDQIIQPYFFGDPFRKRTCLWLKNLPLLIPTNILPIPAPIYVNKNGKNIHWHDSIGKGTLTQKERAKIRSKTFNGIASAMANQWLPHIYNN